MIRRDSGAASRHASFSGTAEIESWRPVKFVPGSQHTIVGTTQQAVSARRDAEELSLQPLAGRPAYPYCDDELRQVARDAYVCWQSLSVLDGDDGKSGARHREA